MKLAEAISKLQAIARQKSEADFDFVFLESGYGLEVRNILYDADRNRGIVVVTDQEL